MMPKKRNNAEQAVTKLRLIDALAGDDMPIIVYSDFERQVLSSLKSVMSPKQAKAIDRIIN